MTTRSDSDPFRTRGEPPQAPAGEDPYDPFRDRDEPLNAPADASDTYDPFRSTNPTVVVHDVPLDVFERAWADRDTSCPQCRRGTAEQRGTAPSDQRRWVRFTCGDVISQEQTAG